MQQITSYALCVIGKGWFSTISQDILGILTGWNCRIQKMKG